MFPFRRNGPKKRGKGGGGGGGRRPHDHGGGGGPRRVPGSAAELLGTMQPTTKALAQMLAGNARMSGQLAHARNVLAQANRLVDERMPDRLPPAAREQFFDQLAILRLTIQDAEDAAEAALAEPSPEPAARPAPPVDAARLREVALRLATAEPVPPAHAAAAAAAAREEEADEPPHHAHDDVTSGYALPERQAPADDAPDLGAAAGPRRERLRLKPVQRPASPGDA